MIDSEFTKVAQEMACMQIVGEGEKKKKTQISAALCRVSEV